MKIVNIIPHGMSGETHQDSSPNIAVNPANPREIVITALTPNTGKDPDAPVYVSTNGGNTWALKDIVPDKGANGTSGITAKYGQTSNQLYVAELKGSDPYTWDALRTINPSAGATMTKLFESSGQQPYVAVGTVPSGPDAGEDRLYIGANILSPPFGSGQTSTIVQAMKAQTGIPAFDNISIDSRPKNIPAFQDLQPPQNGPQVRPAVHPDGTVYAAFYSWKTWEDLGDGNGIISSDLVIVRDDNWGQSATPYGDLIDNGDGHAGKRIATDVPLKFYGKMGQERSGGDLAIAIDPTDSSTVYLAWSEWQAQPDGTDLFWLHLRKSSDKGQTWPQSLLTIRNGKNPGLAINEKGEIGFLYQQLTGQAGNQHWVTHLAFSQNGSLWNNTVLARTPAATPVRQFFPYIGDYADIMAVGNIFYGVFCANNTPNPQNFPQGVTYQRNHNFTTHTLLAPDGVTHVAASIDPFFFTTPFLAPTIKAPSQNETAAVLIILFGIIQDGGGAYIDQQGHIHIVGPGDPGPVWDYLVNLAQYRLATAAGDQAGLQMQKLALQNIIDLATNQLNQINNQLERG